ncbi:MAG: hypothetical protein ACI4EO_07720 [Blautia sp.]
MAKGKAIRLTDEELKKIVEDTMKKGIEEGRKEFEIREEKRKAGLLHNTKVLLENYMKFKLFISESVKSVADMEEAKYNATDADEILRIFGLREDDKKIRSIGKSVATMSLLMAHVDRMLDVYKQSCEGSSSVVVQRRYQVIERMYLREKRMTATQIAEEFNLEPRVIQKDAKMAREDLRVLMFGIEAIVKDLV